MEEYPFSDEEGAPIIQSFNPAADSELTAILLHAVLMRSGGQQHFTAADLVSVSKNYGRIRMLINRKTCDITMTLITRKEVSDAT